MLDSPFLLDAVGDFGPRYRAYANSKGQLKLLTPEGFPHPRQLEYIESTSPYTLWAGQRGSGKSFAAVWDNIFTAYRVPGCTQIIFRRTMGELRRTIIKEFIKLPEALRGRFTDSALSPRLELDNGSNIYFASVNTEDAARKFLSGEFLKITFDEWCEIPTKWWLFISGSARSTVTEDWKGAPIGAQVKGLSNPGGVGADTLRHLFGADCDKACPKNLDIIYDPADYLFIPSVLDDNPAYAADKPAGKAYRKMLSAQPKAIRNAWLYGHWTGFEGMFFDAFDKDVTVIPHNKALSLMAKQSWMPVFLGTDVGVVHHCYTCWSTLVELPLEDGTKHIFILTFDELLLKGRSERALAGEILDKMRDDTKLKQRIRRIYLSPETFGESSRTRARVIGDEFVADGVVRPIPAKTEKFSRPNGLRLMYTLLAERRVLLDGWTESRVVCDWLISDNCEELLAALPWAISDPDHDGDIRKEGDAPQLDVLDGARYGLYSHHVAGEKPAGEIYKDKMELIKQGGMMPSKSMQMFSEHVKRIKEIREGTSQQTQSAKWARERHPRMDDKKGTQF
jgi:hypothetical protein